MAKLVQTDLKIGLYKGRGGKMSARRQFHFGNGAIGVRELAPAFTGWTPVPKRSFGRWGWHRKSGGEPPHSKIVGAPTIPKTGSLRLRWPDERSEEDNFEKSARCRWERQRLFETRQAGGTAFRNWGGGDSRGDVAARRWRTEDHIGEAPCGGEPE